MRLKPACHPPALLLPHVSVHSLLCRRGPSLRECVLLHAVARLALHPVITNIQASWVKMGPEAAGQLLAAGCNDMGGTIMNESITRAAGTGRLVFDICRVDSLVGWLAG